MNGQNNEQNNNGGTFEINGKFTSESSIDEVNKFINKAQKIYDAVNEYNTNEQATEQTNENEINNSNDINENNKNDENDKNDNIDSSIDDTINEFINNKNINTTDFTTDLIKKVSKSFNNTFGDTIGNPSNHGSKKPLVSDSLINLICNLVKIEGEYDNGHNDHNINKTNRKTDYNSNDLDDFIKK